jgi:hypothetical protein
MKSRKPLLAALCLLSVFSATPSLAKADVSVSIGVATPGHYHTYRHFPRHGHILAPGYRHGHDGHHWSSNRWDRRGTYYRHEPNRWHRDHHFSSRSQWGDRGRHHQHWRGHHGKKHRRD